MATTKNTSRGWRTYQARVHTGRAVEVLLQAFEQIGRGDFERAADFFAVSAEEADEAIALSGHRRVRRVK